MISSPPFVRPVLMGTAVSYAALPELPPHLAKGPARFALVSIDETGDMRGRCYVEGHPEIPQSGWMGIISHMDLTHPSEIGREGCGALSHLNAFAEMALYPQFPPQSHKPGMLVCLRDALLLASEKGKARLVEWNRLFKPTFRPEDAANTAWPMLWIRAQSSAHGRLAATQRVRADLAFMAETLNITPILLDPLILPTSWGP